jgi:hypothetical protein
MPGGACLMRIVVEQFRRAVDLGHPVRSLIASPPDDRVHPPKFDPQVLKAHRGDPCHFVVSLRIESGFSITEVMAFVGHSSTLMTMERDGHLFLSLDHQNAKVDAKLPG